ncbi:hypothetical protein [Lacipirellula sp.]|uniref:hypothetical protein n=1 Tax=Lacipirellula sp. TaxID=2691419 RepID=UPI003D0C000A
MSDEEDAIEAMTAKLRFADAEIRLSRLECERLEKLSQNNQELSITKETVLEQMREAAASLLELKNGVNSAIRDLAPRIEAVPYRQLNSDEVVLRAVFTVNVAQLLPDALSRLLAGDAGAGSGDILSVKVTVDLFEPSNAPKHAIQAIALKHKNLTLQQIGDELGISKRSAHLAVQYGAAMEATGVTDPFVELTEPPDSASRWRGRGHRRNAG